MGFQAIIDPIVADIAGAASAVGGALGSAGSAIGGALGLGGAATDISAGAGELLGMGSSAGVGATTDLASTLGSAAGATGASAGASAGADFLSSAAESLGAGVPGSTTSTAAVAAPSTAAATPSAAAPATAAPATGSVGSAASAAAPASVAASPTTTGALGSVDPSLIQSASAPSALTGSPSAATSLASTAAPTGLAAPTTAATAPTSALTGSGVLGALKTYGPLAMSGVGLLSSALEGTKTPKFQGAVSAEASQLATQGAQLQSYLTSGTLPPGVSAGLQSAHDAAAATIRSQYASRGQTGSSAEAQDLANLATTTVSQGAQIASNLLQQGVSESEFSAQLYQSLMQSSMQQDAALSQSIASFAGGLAGLGLKSAQTPVG
jgi:hypothetical protein